MVVRYEKENRAVLEKSLVVHLEKHLRKQLPKISKDVRALVKNSLLENETTKWLLSEGGIKEMGVVGMSSKLNTIISTIAQSVKVEYKPLHSTKGGIRGGLQIKLVKADYSDLLGLSISEIATRSGKVWRWLEHLLLQADTIINDFYFTEPNPYELRHFSRAGGYMRPAQGRRWSVPPQHSGHAKDNFITRTLTTKDFQTRLRTTIGGYL